MIKRYILGLIAVFIFTAFFCLSSWAKEDTAQISLKKTAVSKQNVHLYKIKKGDVISAIIRRLPGITQDDIPDNYRIIKQLNPDVENFNKLYTGQIIKLPGKSTYSTEVKKEEVQPVALSASPKTYKIKKGDNLITIIHRELKIKNDTTKALHIIKSMNPRIANANKIYFGQVIKLPGKTVLVTPPDETKIIEQAGENQTEAEKLIETKGIKVMPQEAKLAVIKHILTQMKASVSSSGNYYLPISKAGHITIDCKKIPIIEFDDKTTVFLDWENRLNDNLKKIIRDNWKSFSIVKVDKKDDVVTILRKVIAATKAYSMNKRDTPITTGNRPPVEIIVDWLIVKTDSKQNSSLIQGLRFVPENNSLLPKAIKNYAKQNGLIITEIDKETGLAGKPEEIYSLPPMPVFPATSAKDFSYALITHLGFTADKDADVKVFDVVKDGFNLSIKADVLIKNTDKKYIIYSRNLPQQFINVFKGKGYGLIFVADSDSPKIIMEKILQSLAIPSAYGYFTFSGLDKNQAPFTLGFTGTKIKTDKDQYVIDFAIDDGLRGLISESWQASFARY
ncbi:MAG: LysM peptidoglycan-binding domain-containing protein [Smithellaceae bacterium]